MLYDPQDFLHSMCQFAAARAATSLSPACAVAYATTGNGGVKPWNLFLNQADEDSAADPYAVLRVYSGTKERINPKPTLGVQLAVYSINNLNGWFLANSLYRAFCLTNQEAELRTVQIPGFKVSDNSANGTFVLVDAQTVSMPCQVGPRDERGRLKIVSNFNLGFYKSA